MSDYPVVETPKLIVKEIRSLSDFTSAIEGAIDSCGIPDGNVVQAPLWYRGCSDQSYKLIPSLYRHKSINSIDALMDVEAQFLSRFKNRSIPYIQFPLTTNWDYLFLMQHYGVPTRLLDWTENPYIALYFALQNATGGDPKCDAAIWILNPFLWNKSVFTHIRLDGKILAIDDSSFSGYAPGTELKVMGINPAAIYGSHNSPRIVAQRGSFTIFGKELQEMEKTFEDQAFPKEALVKLIIPRDSIIALYRALLSTGVSDSVVYPDLSGLARELKFSFGYGA